MFFFPLHTVSNRFWHSLRKEQLLLENHFLNRWRFFRPQLIEIIKNEIALPKYSENRDLLRLLLTPGIEESKIILIIQL